MMFAVSQRAVLFLVWQSLLLMPLRAAEQQPPNSTLR